MKLLFVNGHMRVGGGEKSLLDLLTHLDYDKYQVDLLLTEGKGEYFDMLPPQVHVYVVETGHAYGSIGKSILANLQAGRFWAIYYRLVVMLSNFLGKRTLFLQRPVFGLYKCYDCAIAYRPGPCADLVAYTMRARRRICWWHNGSINYNSNQICEIDSTWRHFDNIVSVSEGCKKLLTKHFSYPAERIVVIPNMIDVERIRMLAGETSLYTDDGRLHFVTVGRLSQEKRVDNALRAARLLIDNSCKPFCWHIIGDGELMNELKALSSELKLGDYVDFLGNKTNPYPYMKFADLLIHTSHVESQSLTVLEAMALGTPCVVTRSLGPDSFMVNGENGILVEKDVESIVDGLFAFISLSEDKKAQMCKAAQEAVKLFMPSIICGFFNELLQ